MTPTIRVAVINLPALMRDIVEFEVSHQPDFEVVPLAPSIAARVAAGSPSLDAVIVGDGDGSLPDASDMLDLWPRAKILVVGGGGRDATLITLRRHRTELGHLDAEQLVQAIRSAIDSRGKGDA